MPEKLRKRTREFVTNGGPKERENEIFPIEERSEMPQLSIDDNDIRDVIDGKQKYIQNKDR